MSNMKQYRSRDGDVKRVVTSSGHVALVGPDWKPLPPIYHNAALRSGCECDAKTIVENTAKVENSATAEKAPNAEVLIERALKTMLERDQQGDFNQAGEPLVGAVAKLAGFNVRRADITPVWRRLQAEADAAAVGAGDNDGAGDDAGDED